VRLGLACGPHDLGCTFARTNPATPPRHENVPPQVVGVGGGGSNAVNRMKQANLQGVEFWVANTDAQVSGGFGAGVSL
jgi:hypothetical protein